ncbi:MAG: adenylate kinase family protein [Candidatus Lokiarchaeota archaeon]|nr:adenylate kinase family protein [Candidatus Lokiarchaeota archaeon]MCK4481196.1 adenylate kinase family protein [Candidatus Lokiarchaeota archaeon]
MKNIIISGTPGCGKTSVAKELSNLIDSKIISLNELAISDKFSFEYDQERKTYIVDFEIFLPYVLKKIEEIKQDNPLFLIIESHFSDIIPEKFIDFVFILRCDPDELFKRLEKKKYDKNKITENTQAEILGNCVNYFIQKQIKVPIFEIDTTNLNIETVAKIIKEIVVENKDGQNYYIGKIDWLEKLFVEDRLNEFFNE